MHERAGYPGPEWQAIGDWLIDAALRDVDLTSLFTTFCDRIVATGLPIQRAHLATRSLHPMFVAGTVTWHRSDGADAVQIPSEDDDSAGWRQSPLYALMQSERLEARYRLEGDGGWRDFPMLATLRASGATDYFARITLFGAPEAARPRQDGCIFSWTTDRAGGFDDSEIVALRWLGVRFGLVAKLDRREQTAKNVAAAYLGREAGRRVLDGQIKLGDGEVMPAIVWYCDMRGSTALADVLPGPEFLRILNAYFACTAGVVLEYGGEVLQFIGDAVLAIFQIDDFGGPAEAAAAAMAAAHAAEARMADLNAQRAATGEAPLDYGLALHHGPLMFGNIGVPERVAFSVIGRTVNEVARLEELTKTLERHTLVSAPFAELLDLPWTRLGDFQVAGVKQALTVYAPSTA